MWERFSVHVKTAETFESPHKEAIYLCDVGKLLKMALNYRSTWRYTPMRSHVCAQRVEKI